jgi:hypothetical protein
MRFACVDVRDHIVSCGVDRDQDGLACGFLSDWPGCNGRYQGQNSDASTERRSYSGANDRWYRLAQDTLTKADKLEVAYVHRPVAVEPIMLVTKARDGTPPQPPSPPATPKIMSRHSHDPDAKKVAAVSPGRRIKGQESKKSNNVER